MVDRKSIAAALRQGDGDELEQDGAVGAVDLTHWYTPVGRTLATIVRRIGAILGARAALALTLALGALIAFACAFLASRVYDAVTESDGVAGIDQPALRLAMRARSPGMA